MIFDAHLHLPCYNDDDKTLGEKKNRLLDDLERNGVAGAIVISDSETSSVIGTPSECVELFEDTDNIYVMGAVSPLIDYNARLTLLDNLLKKEKIIALKVYPGHEAFYMDDPRLYAIYELCEKYDVPLAVHTGWDNPQYTQAGFFADIAKKHPNLKIVICHMCWPEIDLCFRSTTRYPNVYWDISSLAYESDVIEKTSALLSRFAQIHADRILFGSDYGACSIMEHINLVNALGIGQEAKEMILASNALKLYKINLPKGIIR